MTAPGHRGDIKKALSGHGDIVSDETDGDALTAVVHSDDVDEAGQASLGAVGVRRRCWSARSAPAAARSTVRGARASDDRHSVDRRRHRAAARANVLRQTLGLSNVAAPGGVNGDGVVVALIDSRPVAERRISRCRGSRASTTSRTCRMASRRSRQPYDDFGHGTHVAGPAWQRRRRCRTTSARASRRPCKFVALKVLDGAGQGHDEHGHQGDRVRHRPQRARSTSRSSTCRSATPFIAPAKYDPLVQAVERASAGRHRGGRRGRQQRAGPERRRRVRLHRHQLARQRAIVRSRSARSTRRTRSRATATPSRRSARAVRRGSTPAPSPTSWRRACTCVSNTDTSSYLYTNLPNNRQTRERRTRCST